MSEFTGDQLTEIVDKHVAQLREFFDAVQIVASAEVKGGTRMASRGGGNWYARRWMAEAFLRRDDVDELSTSIADKIEPPREDDWRKE